MKASIKKLEKIAFIILSLFALFGAIVSAQIIHELSHKSDFQEYAQDEKICALVLPQNASDLFNESAYYEFSYNAEDKPMIDKIKEYTEFKAYSLTIAVFIMFSLSLLVVLSKRWLN